MLKYLILLVFLVVTVKAECHGQSDCEPDECCLRDESETQCHKRPKENAYCNPYLEPLDKLSDKIYKDSCPCVEGLKCIFGSRYDDLSFKCRKGRQ